MQQPRLKRFSPDDKGGVRPHDIPPDALVPGLFEDTTKRYKVIDVLGKTSEAEVREAVRRTGQPVYCLDTESGLLKVKLEAVAAPLGGGERSQLGQIRKSEDGRPEGEVPLVDGGELIGYAVFSEASNQATKAILAAENMAQIEETIAVLSPAEAVEMRYRLEMPPRKTKDPVFLKTVNSMLLGVIGRDYKGMLPPGDPIASMPDDVAGAYFENRLDYMTPEYLPNGAGKHAEALPFLDRALSAPKETRRPESEIRAAARNRLNQDIEEMEGGRVFPEHDLELIRDSEALIKKAAYSWEHTERLIGQRKLTQEFVFAFAINRPFLLGRMEPESADPMREVMADPEYWNLEPSPEAREQILGIMGRGRSGRAPTEDEVRREFAENRVQSIIVDLSQLAALDMLRYNGIRDRLILQSVANDMGRISQMQEKAGDKKKAAQWRVLSEDPESAAELMKIWY